MPSETIYLPDDLREYGRQIVRENDYDNLSQAIQHIMLDHRAQVHDGDTDD
jgi:hypothetical protein